MKLKEITLHKNFKLGLPNFSNIDVGVYMTFEIGEKEELDWDSAWDIINQQISNQCDLDPMWLKTDELKKQFKLTIKVPKKGGDNKNG